MLLSTIKFVNVNKVYNVAGSQFFALNDVNFTLTSPAFVCIVGESGAGKSTILNILGGMDSLSSGDYYLDDICINKLSEKQMTLFRREDIGFIFQSYNLMSNLTAIENVMLSNKNITFDMAKEALDSVGLNNKYNNFLEELSGGEAQRVAIARAIVKNAKIILADEPTGALDSKTGEQIFSILHKISLNKLVIVVTHNPLLKEISDKVIEVHDGKILKIYDNPNPKKISDISW